MFEINDKTAVITGAGKGIGRSMALLFARQGARVHILDTDKEAGEAVAGEINETEGAARFHHTNVADQPAVNQTFDQIGTLDILVNNAGISHIGTPGDTSRQDIAKKFNS